MIQDLLYDSVRVAGVPDLKKVLRCQVGGLRGLLRDGVFVVFVFVIFAADIALGAEDSGINLTQESAPRHGGYPGERQQ